MFAIADVAVAVANAAAQVRQAATEVIGSNAVESVADWLAAHGQVQGLPPTVRFRAAAHGQVQGCRPRSGSGLPPTAGDHACRLPLAVGLPRNYRLSSHADGSATGTENRSGSIRGHAS